MNHQNSTSKFSNRDTLVTQRFKSDINFGIRLNRSVQSLALPFDAPKQMKFKRDKNCRKQTQMTMLIETQEKIPRALRASHKFNRSVIFQDDMSNSNYKRMASPGTFHSLSLQSRPQVILSRSRQDLGVQKNRKKPSLFRDKSNDPILIGQVQPVKRTKLQVINQQARYKQNGQRVRQQLIWEKVKPKTYLERFRAARQIK